MMIVHEASKTWAQKYAILTAEAQVTLSIRLIPSGCATTSIALPIKKKQSLVSQTGKYLSSI
jgi:hypothetical protein